MTEYFMFKGNRGLFRMRSDGNGAECLQSQWDYERWEHVYDHYKTNERIDVDYKVLLSIYKKGCWAHGFILDLRRQDFYRDILNEI